MKYIITDIQQFNKIINNRTLNGDILLETNAGIYPFIIQSEYTELLKYVETVIKLEQTIDENIIPVLNVLVGETALNIPNFRLETNAGEYITPTVSNANLTISYSPRGGDLSIDAVSVGQCTITLSAPETDIYNALLIRYNITISEIFGS